MSEEDESIEETPGGGAPAPEAVLEVGLRTFLDQTPNPVILVDERARIVYANRPVERLLGFSPEELRGQDVERLVPADVSPQHRAYVDSYMENPEPRPMGMERDLSAVAKDGRLVPVEIALGPLQTPAGPVVSVNLIDLTARKRAEAAATAYREELERSNRELEEFAYVASHDLQAPLRKIRAFGGRLLERAGDSLDEKARDYLGRMTRSAESMQELVDDLLTFSRVTTRAAPASRVELDAILESVLADLSEEVQETGAVVEVGRLPAVHAEASQMRQLFQNLVGNALRFHRPDESPRVRVRDASEDVGASPARPGFSRIVVADEGIGFEPYHGEKIFQVFQRLHGKEEYAGSGIGLAIVKKIVERHGGRVQAEGRPGRGATFTVELPRSGSRGGP